jgi:hypothetical protein
MVSTTKTAPRRRSGYVGLGGLAAIEAALAGSDSAADVHLEWLTRLLSNPSEPTRLAASLFREQGRDEAARRLEKVWRRTLGGTDDLASDTEEEFVELAGLLGPDRAVRLLIERFGQATIKSAATPKPGAPRTAELYFALACLVEATREAKALDVKGACKLIKDSNASDGVRVRRRGRTPHHLQSVASIRSAYYRCHDYYDRADPELVVKKFYSRVLVEKWRKSELPYERWLRNFLRHWQERAEQDSAMFEKKRF